MEGETRGVDVDMTKVETVIRRLMKEYDILGERTDVLQDAIQEVISSEDDRFLGDFTDAWDHSDLDDSRIWRSCVEA